MPTMAMPAYYGHAYYGYAYYGYNLITTAGTCEATSLMCERWKRVPAQWQ